MAILARAHGTTQLCSGRQVKNPPAGTGRVPENGSQVLGADYIGRLEPFGAFQQIELNRLALIQRAVAALSDGFSWVNGARIEVSGGQNV